MATDVASIETLTAPPLIEELESVAPVSYTHLTLPTKA